jgi:hypothetical protein
MNKLPLLLISAGLLAACGTAATSPSSTGFRETMKLGTVQTAKASSADSERDVNLVNRPVTKGSKPLPVGTAQPQQQVSSSSNQSQTGRCGTAWSQSAGTRTTIKRPPLPMCLAQ